MKGNTMSNEINLGYLWKVFRSAWWKIVIIAVVFAIAAAGLTFLIPEKYSSSTSFYINNASSTTEYTTSSLLSAVEYLANDYVEIILSDKMIDSILADIRQKTYEEIDPSTLTAKNLRNMISSKTSANTSIFNITVTCTDRAMAKDICQYIEKHAPAIIKEIARPATEVNIYYKDGEHYYPYENQLECVSVVRSATDAVHVSPSLIVNTVIGGFVGALLAYALFFLRKFFDTVIRSANDVKELIDKPILADIPDWNISESMQKRKEY